ISKTTRYNVSNASCLTDLGYLIKDKRGPFKRPNAPVQTFSRTDIGPTRLKDWKIKPISRRNFRNSCFFNVATSWPSTRTLPEVGVCNPLRWRSKVDFPDPERPSKTV